MKRALRCRRGVIQDDTDEQDAPLDKPHAHNGFIFRQCARLFRLIDRPWKMYPLGVLFGLGFDTSTEVALLAIASIQAAQGTPLYVILVFPFLFMAGMMLVDTIDGACMFWAYGSTLFREDKVLRLYYAIVLTLMSVLVALTIGLLQMFTLIRETRHLEGSFWDGVGRAGEHYDVIGGCIVAGFVVIVAASALLHWLYMRRQKHSHSVITSSEVQCPEQAQASGPDKSTILVAQNCVS